MADFITPKNGRKGQKRAIRSPQTGSFSGVHGTNGPQDPAGRPLDARRARPRLGVGAVGGGWWVGGRGGVGRRVGVLKGSTAKRRLRKKNYLLGEIPERRVWAASKQEYSRQNIGRT